MITTVVGSVPASLATAVSWAANAVAVLCIIPLCVTTLQRKTDPPPATWGIWAAAGIVGSAGMAMAGADASAWSLKLALSVGPLAVAIVSRIVGVPWVVRPVDRWCLVLAGIGLVFLLFGEGLAAMWLAIAVNIIGSVPTCLHGLRAPFRARYFPFACASGSVLAVLALAVPWPWTVASVAYLLYLLIDTSAIMAFIAYGRARARRFDVGEQHREAIA